MSASLELLKFGLESPYSALRSEIFVPCWVR